MQRIFCLAIALLFGSPTFADSRPNIILLYTDDQSFLSTGATGNDQVKTPHMDQLAADGLLFTRHYNSTSICMGSRASVMTGMYEYKTGCNFSHGPMHRDTFAKSYPVLLRAAGYRTGFAGKFGFAVNDGPSEGVGSYDVLPVDQFDSWGGGTGQTHYQTEKNRYLAKYADRYPHATRAYGAFAQDFIKASETDDRPFCLTLFFKSPHRPFTPDPYFDDVYRDATFARPANYGRQASRHLSLQARLGRQNLTFFHDMGFDPEHYQDTMRKYHQLIHGVDYAIGMITDQLRRQGLDDETVILLTSDNGFFCGSHGFGGKVLPYEEGSKVPLVIFDPRSDQRGKRVDEVTGTVDIAPTILELAGQPIPQNIDGKSLVDAIKNPERASIRESLPLFQVWGAPTTFSMSVVSRTHKYIYWCCGENMTPSEELFDITADPLEMHNMVDAPEQAETLARMRRAYRDQLAHWKADAVPYNNYQPFATLLDPEVSWGEKRDLVSPGMWNAYLSLVKQLGVEPAQAFNYETVLKASNRQ